MRWDGGTGNNRRNAGIENGLLVGGNWMARSVFNLNFFCPRLAEGLFGEVF